MLADDEYFDEGAAQVRRLLDRDRKELMTEQNEPSKEYDAEYSKASNGSSARDGSNGASSSQVKAYEEGVRSCSMADVTFRTYILWCVEYAAEYLACMICRLPFSIVRPFFSELGLPCRALKLEEPYGESLQVAS